MGAKQGKAKNIVQQRGKQNNIKNHYNIHDQGQQNLKDWQDDVLEDDVIQLSEEARQKLSMQQSREKSQAPRVPPLVQTRTLPIPTDTSVNGQSPLQPWRSESPAFGTAVQLYQVELDGTSEGGGKQYGYVLVDAQGQVKPARLIIGTDNRQVSPQQLPRMQTQNQDYESPANGQSQIKAQPGESEQTNQAVQDAVALADFYCDSENEEREGDGATFTVGSRNNHSADKISEKKALEGLRRAARQNPRRFQHLVNLVSQSEAQQRRQSDSDAHISLHNGMEEAKTEQNQNALSPVSCSVTRIHSRPRQAGENPRMQSFRTDVYPDQLQQKRSSLAPSQRSDGKRGGDLQSKGSVGSSVRVNLKSALSAKQSGHEQSQHTDSKHNLAGPDHRDLSASRLARPGSAEAPSLLSSVAVLDASTASPTGRRGAPPPGMSTSTKKLAQITRKLGPVVNDGGAAGPGRTVLIHLHSESTSTCRVLSHRNSNRSDETPGFNASLDQRLARLAKANHLRESPDFPFTATASSGNTPGLAQEIHAAAREDCGRFGGSAGSSSQGLGAGATPGRAAQRTESYNHSSHCLIAPGVGGAYSSATHEVCAGSPGLSTQQTFGAKKVNLSRIVSQTGKHAGGNQSQGKLGAHLRGTGKEQEQDFSSWNVAAQKLILGQQHSQDWAPATSPQRQLAPDDTLKNAAVRQKQPQRPNLVSPDVVSFQNLQQNASANLKIPARPAGDAAGGEDKAGSGRTSSLCTSFESEDQGHHLRAPEVRRTRQNSTKRSLTGPSTTKQPTGPHLSPTQKARPLDSRHLKDGGAVRRMRSSQGEGVRGVAIFDRQNSSSKEHKASKPSSKGSSRQGAFAIKATLERKKTSVASPILLQSDKASKETPPNRLGRSGSRSNSRSSDVRAQQDQQIAAEDFLMASANSSNRLSFSQPTSPLSFNQGFLQPTQPKAAPSNPEFETLRNQSHSAASTNSQQVLREEPQAINQQVPTTAGEAALVTADGASRRNSEIVGQSQLAASVNANPRPSLSAVSNAEPAPPADQANQEKPKPVPRVSQLEPEEAIRNSKQSAAHKSLDAHSGGIHIQHQHQPPPKPTQGRPPQAHPSTLSGGARRKSSLDCVPEEQEELQYEESSSSSEARGFQGEVRTRGQLTAHERRRAQTAKRMARAQKSMVLPPPSGPGVLESLPLRQQLTTTGPGNNDGDHHGRPGSTTLQEQKSGDAMTSAHFGQQDQSVTMQGARARRGHPAASPFSQQVHLNQHRHRRSKERLAKRAAGRSQQDVRQMRLMHSPQGSLVVPGRKQGDSLPDKSIQLRSQSSSRKSHNLRTSSEEFTQRQQRKKQISEAVGQIDSIYSSLMTPAARRASAKHRTNELGSRGTFARSGENQADNTFTSCTVEAKRRPAYNSATQGSIPVSSSDTTPASRAGKKKGTRHTAKVETQEVPGGVIKGSTVSGKAAGAEEEERCLKESSSPKDDLSRQEDLEADESSRSSSNLSADLYPDFVARQASELLDRHAPRLQTGKTCRTIREVSCENDQSSMGGVSAQVSPQIPSVKNLSVHSKTAGCIISGVKRRRQSEGQRGARASELGMPGKPQRGLTKSNTKGGGLGRQHSIQFTAQADRTEVSLFEKQGPLTESGVNQGLEEQRLAEGRRMQFAAGKPQLNSRVTSGFTTEYGMSSQNSPRGSQINEIELCDDVNAKAILYSKTLLQPIQSDKGETQESSRDASLKRASVPEPDQPSVLNLLKCPEAGHRRRAKTSKQLAAAPRGGPGDLQGAAQIAKGRTLRPEDSSMAGSRKSCVKPSGACSPRSSGAPTPKSVQFSNASPTKGTKFPEPAKPYQISSKTEEYKTFSLSKYESEVLREKPTNMTQSRIEYQKKEEVEFFAAVVQPVANSKARQLPDRGGSSQEVPSQAVRPNLLQAEVARETSQPKGSDRRDSSPSASPSASKLIRQFKQARKEVNPPGFEDLKVPEVVTQQPTRHKNKSGTRGKGLLQKLKAHQKQKQKGFVKDDSHIVISRQDIRFEQSPVPSKARAGAGSALVQSVLPSVAELTEGNQTSTEKMMITVSPSIKDYHTEEKNASLVRRSSIVTGASLSEELKQPARPRQMTHSGSPMLKGEPWPLASTEGRTTLPASSPNPSATSPPAFRPRTGMRLIKSIGRVYRAQTPQHELPNFVELFDLTRKRKLLSHLQDTKLVDAQTAARLELENKQKYDEALLRAEIESRQRRAMRPQSQEACQALDSSTPSAQRNSSVKLPFDTNMGFKDYDSIANMNIDNYELTPSNFQRRASQSSDVHTYGGSSAYNIDNFEFERVHDSNDLSPMGKSASQMSDVQFRPSSKGGNSREIPKKVQTISDVDNPYVGSRAQVDFTHAQKDQPFKFRSICEVPGANAKPAKPAGLNSDETPNLTPSISMRQATSPRVETGQETITQNQTIVNSHPGRSLAAPQLPGPGFFSHDHERGSSSQASRSELNFALPETRQYSSEDSSRVASSRHCRSSGRSKREPYSTAEPVQRPASHLDGHRQEQLLKTAEKTGKTGADKITVPPGDASQGAPKERPKVTAFTRVGKSRTEPAAGEHASLKVPEKRRVTSINKDLAAKQMHRLQGEAGARTRAAGEGYAEPGGTAREAPDGLSDTVFRDDNLRPDFLKRQATAKSCASGRKDGTVMHLSGRLRTEGNVSAGRQPHSALDAGTISDPLLHEGLSNPNKVTSTSDLESFASSSMNAQQRVSQQEPEAKNRGDHTPPATSGFRPGPGQNTEKHAAKELSSDSQKRKDRDRRRFSKATSTPTNLKSNRRFMGTDMARQTSEVKSNVSRMRHQSITTTSCVSQRVSGKERVNQYQVMQKIGSGSFSEVYLCVDMGTKQIYAMKVMNKPRLRRRSSHIGRAASALDNVQAEMAIMKKLDHPYILKLYEVIDDPTQPKIYLIIEHSKHGSVERKVEKLQRHSRRRGHISAGDASKVDQVKEGLKKPAGIPEDTMRKYFGQLVLALEYCHNELKIIHRDIKPDNLLLDENDNIKLSDFGVSQFTPQDGDSIRSNAGSSMFFSPEACIGSSYRGRLNDIWACGVTLYYMATGNYPFVSREHQKLYRMIQQTEPDYPPEMLGTPLHDLICRLLRKQPEDRITLAQIKEHPWITKNGMEPLREVTIDEYTAPTEAELEHTFTRCLRVEKFEVHRKTNDAASAAI